MTIDGSGFFCVCVAGCNPRTTQYYHLSGICSGSTGIASMITVSVFPWKLTGDLEMTLLTPANYVK